MGLRSSSVQGSELAAKCCATLLSLSVHPASAPCASKRPAASRWLSEQAIWKEAGEGGRGTVEKG